MTHRLASHARANAIAYLALFVALGGTTYAAVSLPANSVGARQIRNHSITPDKLDPSRLAGAVRAWAEVSAAGHLIAGEGNPTAKVQPGSVAPGVYVVKWRTAPMVHCASVGAVAIPIGAGLTPGFVVTDGPQPKPERTTVQANVYNAQGQPTALAFTVAVLC